MIVFTVQKQFLKHRTLLLFLKFALPRALFIANQHHMQALWIIAWEEEVSFSCFLREKLANLKALYETTCKVKPHFLWEVIPIDGPSNIQRIFKSGTEPWSVIRIPLKIRTSTLLWNFYQRRISSCKEVIQNAKIIFDIGGHIRFFSEWCFTQNPKLTIHYFRQPFEENRTIAKKDSLLEKNTGSQSLCTKQ